MRIGQVTLSCLAHEIAILLDSTQHHVPPISRCVVLGHSSTSSAVQGSDGANPYPVWFSTLKALSPPLNELPIEGVIA
jgi:hypothetical protein